MKILSIQPALRGLTVDPFPGGKSYYCYDLCRELAARGHEVSIMPWRDEIIAPGVKYALSQDGLYADLMPTQLVPSAKQFIVALGRMAVKMMTGNPREKYREGINDLFFNPEAGLRNAMKTVKPDVVHVHYTYADFQKVYRKCGFTTPLVFTHHTYGCAENLDLCDMVIFNTDAHRGDVMREYPDRIETFQTIYPYVHPIYQEESAVAKGKQLLFVAAFRREDFIVAKGIDLLFEAYEKFPALNKYTLLLVGDGPSRAKYEAVAKAKNLNMKFLGRRSPSEIAGIMRECAFFVLPSRMESCGLVYMEALCMGLPIIGYPLTVTDFTHKFEREIGVPFDANTCTGSELAEIILGALGDEKWFDPIMRREMMDQARHAFGMERFIEQYLSVYERVIG